MSAFLLRRVGFRLPIFRRLYSQGKTAPPPQTHTPGESNLISKLQARFAPTQLLVKDVSGGCGDFYAITISSEAFKGLSTLKQHRMVQDELKEEIGAIHGLQLKTSPSES